MTAVTVNWSKCPVVKLTHDEEKHAGKPEGKMGEVDVFGGFDTALNAIYKTDLGNSLFKAIQQIGKTITIKMPAVGAWQAGFRQARVSQNQTRADDELSGTNVLIRAHEKKQNLGEVIGRALAKATMNGFAEENFQFPGGLVPDLTYEDLVMYAETKDFRHQHKGELDKYIIETSLALEPFVDAGQGSASTVTFDPWNPADAGKPELARPSDVGLFHELVHAWMYAEGKYVVRETQQHDLRQIYEKVVIGLDPVGTTIANGGGSRKFTENLYRAERGLRLRDTV